MPDALPTSSVGKVHLPPFRKKLRRNVMRANGSSWGCDGKERGKEKARRAIARGQKNSMLLANPSKVALAALALVCVQLCLIQAGKAYTRF